MRFLSIILFFLLSADLCSAQSDLLVLKKHNRTIKSFYPESEMVFSTSTRFYDAYITTIEKDSVFLVQYDIRQVYNSFMIPVLDTVASYHFGVNYHDIISLGKDTKNFNWSGSGATLFGGGALLTIAGLTTWVFAKPNTRYYARPSLVIGAAALTGIGYLLLKSGNRSTKIGKKYSLHYINIK